MALTDLQEQFAVAYATNGGNASHAAIEAGYSAENARTLGPRQMRNPEVIDRILDELHRQRARTGAVGLSVLIEVAQSKVAAPAARVSAARTLVEHAGLIGTARDADEVRKLAAGGRVVDYLRVLEALQGLPSPANDQATSDDQVAPEVNAFLREALA